MKAKITRGKGDDNGTPGKLVTERGFTCDTLELPWRNNRRGVSCIVADTYSGQLWQSPSLGRTVVRLEDKHGRKDCLLHNGNFAGDTEHGEFTQIHGCTEVGKGYGQVDRPDGKGKQFGILNSKATLAALVEHLGPGVHEFEYVWAEGCAPDDLTDKNGAA